MYSQKHDIGFTVTVTTESCARLVRAATLAVKSFKTTHTLVFQPIHCFVYSHRAYAHQYKFNNYIKIGKKILQILQNDIIYSGCYTSFNLPPVHPSFILGGAGF
jgi:hypothetical protein